MRSTTGNKIATPTNKLVVFWVAMSIHGVYCCGLVEFIGPVEAVLL